MRGKKKKRIDALAQITNLHFFSFLKEKQKKKMDDGWIII
jgi:hypothetical protein